MWSSCRIAKTLQHCFHFTKEKHGIMKNIIAIFAYLFNHDLNRVCLVYMFPLRFSGSKFFEATCHSSQEPNIIIS